MDSRNGLEEQRGTATARITIAAAVARIPITLRWRAGQFTLAIDGHRDPLRHSDLAHRAEHLATLAADTSRATAERLAEQQVAERLSATILYGGVYAAGKRAGADPVMLRHQCAQCGEVDFTAASGGPSQLENHRCPHCRGVATAPRPALPVTARRPRRRRPQSVQEVLLAAEDLSTVTVRSYDGPLADWPLHRLLQQVAQERFTVWRGNLYEVVRDDHHHRAVPPDPRDTELIGQLRRAGLVCIGLWLFAVIDGQSRETDRLTLSRNGRKVLRRWSFLHSTAR